MGRCADMAVRILREDRAHLVLSSTAKFADRDAARSHRHHLRRPGHDHIDQHLGWLRAEFVERAHENTIAVSRVADRRLLVHAAGQAWSGLPGAASRMSLELSVVPFVYARSNCS